MNQKRMEIGLNGYTHEVRAEDGTVLLYNDSDSEYIQEFDSMDEIESFRSKLRVEAQKAFSSNKPDSGLIIGQGQVEYSNGPGQTEDRKQIIDYKVPEPIIKLGPIEHISLILAQASCESGVEPFFEIDGVGKIFGKGGRFIGTLMEEELKLFYKAVPLHLEAPNAGGIVQ